MNQLTPNFGEGWMSREAADLCKIAIAFGNFDAGELVLAIHRVQRNKSAKVSTPTVEKALQAVYDAAVEADPALYADVIEARKKAQEYVKGLRNA